MVARPESHFGQCVDPSVERASVEPLETLARAEGDRPHIAHDSKCGDADAAIGGGL